jgi:hypothetical protein
MGLIEGLAGGVNRQEVDCSIDYSRRKAVTSEYRLSRIPSDSVNWEKGKAMSHERRMGIW